MTKLSEKCNIQVPMEVLKWVGFPFNVIIIIFVLCLILLVLFSS